MGQVLPSMVVCCTKCRTKTKNQNQSNKKQTQNKTEKTKQNTQQNMAKQNAILHAGAVAAVQAMIDNCVFEDCSSAGAGGSCCESEGMEQGCSEL